MKTLCNFVSLLLWSWAVRAGRHLAKTWTTAHWRWNLCSWVTWILNLVTDNWTVRTFVSLFWQVTTLEAHTLLLFYRLCVTQGAAQSRCVQILCVLVYSKGAWRKSILKRNCAHEVFVSHNLKDLQQVGDVVFKLPTSVNPEREVFYCYWLSSLVKGKFRLFLKSHAVLIKRCKISK